MDCDKLKAYLAAKPAAREDYPFGEGTMVFKAAGKMFAMAAIDESPLRVTLKCDPQEAISLREMYPAVVPGYYMSKVHWNTVTLDGSIPDADIFSMVDDSYTLVVQSLKKSEREELLK